MGVAVRIDPTSQAGNELAHMLNINADQPAGQMQQGAYALARNNPESALIPLPESRRVGSKFRARSP